MTAIRPDRAFFLATIWLVLPCFATAQPVVTVEATDATVSEAGDTGQFRITRTGGSNAAELRVDFIRGVGDVDCGAGGPNSDCEFEPAAVYFSTTAFAFTIPAGADSLDISVTATPDNVVEGPEEVVLSLDANANYTIGDPSSAMIVIQDDPAVITVVASDPNASESGDPGQFLIARSGGDSEAELRIDFARAVGDSDCQGTAGSDCTFDPAAVFFSATAFAFTIPSGEESLEVDVNPILDAAIEGPEEVVLNLASSPSYVIGNPGSATVTIQDSAAIVTIIATDAEASEEGDPGAVRISRTGGDIASLLRVEFDRNAGDSNCTLAGDCTFDPPALIVSANAIAFDIPAGSEFLDVTLNPILEFPEEGKESVILQILPTANYQVGDPSSATISIIDSELVFINDFEAPTLPGQSCQSTLIAAQEPNLFLDLGLSVIEADTGLEWSICRPDEWPVSGGGCVLDELGNQLSSFETLALFNAGLLGDNLGFDDWRRPARTELSSRVAPLAACVVRQ